MTIIRNQNSPFTDVLEVGNVLTVTAQASSSAKVRLTAVGGQTVGHVVAAGVTSKFGPFLMAQQYAVDALEGTVEFSEDVVSTSSNPLASFSTNSDGSIAGLVDGAGNMYPLGVVHPNLWAQFSATTLCADDGAVLDLSGNANHATRGANLSIAQMNGVPGYYSTLLAGTNGHDPALRMPSINFDYDGGEILLVVSLLKMPAPGADGVLIANAPSASFNGFRIRTRTTGYLDVGLYSTTGSVAFLSGNCINVMLDNTMHQFATLISGRTQQGWMWEDCALTRETIAFPPTCDTRESVSLNFGCTLAVPTVIAHTSATQQRGTVIMRWGPNDPQPAIADITSLLAKLRRDPGRVVTMGDV